MGKFEFLIWLSLGMIAAEAVRWLLGFETRPLMVFAVIFMVAIALTIYHHVSSWRNR